MHLTIFVYTLNMSYTFKFKSAFGNQKSAFKNIKSVFILFSAPCPFLSLRETLFNIYIYHKEMKFYLVPCTTEFTWWIPRESHSVLWKVMQFTEFHRGQSSLLGEELTGKPLWAVIPGNVSAIRKMLIDENLWTY